MKVKIKPKDWFEKNCYTSKYGYEYRGMLYPHNRSYIMGKIVDVDEDGFYDNLAIMPWMCDNIMEEEKLKRKVICLNNGYALCDDGTMWLFYNGKWGKLPEIS